MFPLLTLGTSAHFCPPAAATTPGLPGPAHPVPKRPPGASEVSLTSATCPKVAPPLPAPTLQAWAPGPSLPEAPPRPVQGTSPGSLFVLRTFPEAGTPDGSRSAGGAGPSSRFRGSWREPHPKGMSVSQQRAEAAWAGTATSPHAAPQTAGVRKQPRHPGATKPLQAGSPRGAGRRRGRRCF